MDIDSNSQIFDFYHDCQGVHVKHPEWFQLWGDFVNADMEVMWLYGMIDDGVYDGDLEFVVQEIFRQDEIYKQKRIEFMEMGREIVILHKLST